MVLRRVVAWPYRNCSRLSSGDVQVEEMAYAAGHREVAEKECDHIVVLPDTPLAGDPSKTNAGDVVGSRAAAVAAGGRAEAGGAGIAAIGEVREVVVDNQPMGEVAPGEVVLEAGNTWEKGCPGKNSRWELFCGNEKDRRCDMAAMAIFFQARQVLRRAG